jgi:hypothetical protein
MDSITYIDLLYNLFIVSVLGKRLLAKMTFHAEIRGQNPDSPSLRRRGDEAFPPRLPMGNLTLSSGFVSPELARHG